jgi:hypothetical protein
MIMKKTILLAFLLLGSMAQAAQLKVAKGSTTKAFNGSEGVGGGDEVGLEFQRALQDVIAELQSTMPNLYQKLEENNFSKTVAKAKVVVADDGLGVEYLAYIQDSVAANIPETVTVLVNRQRWIAIQEYKVKKAIAFHEALSLAKLEETGSYVISSRYLANQRMTAEYLNLVLHPKSEKRTSGLAPRGVPRYEKSETQRREEQLARAEKQVDFVCKTYFANKEDRRAILNALEDAVYAVNSYITMLDMGQPDFVQADALSDELVYIVHEAVKGVNSNYSNSIKAFCR